MTGEEIEKKETKRIDETKENQVKNYQKKVGLRMDKQTLQSFGPKKGNITIFLFRLTYFFLP